MYDWTEFGTNIICSTKNTSKKSREMQNTKNVLALAFAIAIVTCPSLICFFFSRHNCAIAIAVCTHVQLLPIRCSSAVSIAGPHCRNNHDAATLPNNSGLLAVFDLFCCCQFTVMDSLHVILTGLLHYTVTHSELACIALTFLPCQCIASDCCLYLL